MLIAFCFKRGQGKKKLMNSCLTQDKISRQTQVDKSMCALMSIPHKMHNRRIFVCV